MKKSLLVMPLLLVGLGLGSCDFVIRVPGTESGSSSTDSTIQSDSSSNDSQTPTPGMLPVAWERNDAYVTFSSRKSAASDEFGESNFVSSQGKFRVGTFNDVSLAPMVTYIDLLDPTDVVVTDATLPEGTGVELLDLEGNQLSLDSYFGEAEKTALTTDGIINFREDIDPELPREIVIRFLNEAFATSEEGVGTLLDYEIEIIDGAYNVTEAKELVLFDNYHTQSSYVNIKKEYLGDHATAETSFDKLVIWNDITIWKADLPSWIMWSSDDGVADEEVYGSLKDWQYVYCHEPDDNPSTVEEFAIYGNYNQINVGLSTKETVDEDGNKSTVVAYDPATDFPYVVSNAKYNDTEVHLPEQSKFEMTTHTALFGSNTTQGPDTLFTYHYEDLGAFGNQGVADRQSIDWFATPDDPEDDVNGGGVIFNKFGCDGTFENVRIQHFFTATIMNGPGSPSGVKRLQGEYRPELTVNRSRISDCYSSMLFNYSDSAIYVNESVIENAGGFLFINQCIPTADSRESGRWVPSGSNADYVDYVEGSEVIIDGKSKLQNWVTGSGGWFRSYSLEAVMQSLKQLVSDPLNDFGKTIFVPYGDNSNRFNAIALTMNCDMEGAGALEPGMKGRVSIGGTDYVNFADGEAEFKSALSSFNPSDVTSFLPVMETLYDTSYGTGFVTSYTTASLAAFPAGNDSPYYISPFVNDFETMDITMLPMTGLVKSLVSNLLPDPYKGQLAPTVEELTVDPELFSGDYCTLAYLYGATPGVPTGLQEVASDLLGYTGTSAYQAVFGLNDFGA